MSKKYAVIGGAGFVGRHFVKSLLEQGHSVNCVDNFSSGTMSRIENFKHLENFKIFKLNVEDTEELVNAVKDCEIIIHLASNPDIAKAQTEPRIDFTQGTVLTESVAEAARRAGVKTILYASGSGVYGDEGETYLREDSPLRPISTYGASKVAGEALLRSYAYMFDIKCLAFRFANVVGPFQTHGVGFDFLNKLRLDNSNLHILGDGTQSKSYIYVDDVVEAVLLAERKVESGFEEFNISTPDFISVNEIADLAINAMDLDKNKVSKHYSGGSRGWKADVPVVRINAEKIRKLGWLPKHNSYQAISESLSSMRN